MHAEGHAGLNLSWDLDFWGRQASLLEQARSQWAYVVPGKQIAPLLLKRTQLAVH